MEIEIKKLINDFFEKLGLDYKEFKLNYEEEYKRISIIIETEESGLFIGPSGKNLISISKILELLLFKKFIIKFRVSIKINDFELNKNPKLIGFLSKQIEKLIRYKKDIELPYYNSYERKLIHEYVQNLKNPKITTKSIGEGNNRRINLFIKIEKLSIDVDGTSI